MRNDQNCKMRQNASLVRVEFFSDAVFAISITLLIVDLRPRDTKMFTAADLHDYWPQIFTYFLSFTIVAMQWMDHHTVFHQTERCNKGMVWLNFLFLMCIAFLPFPTAILGHFPGQKISAVFYSGTVVATILTRICLWSYIVYWAHLSKPHIPGKFKKRVTRLWTGALGVAIALLVVAFFQPWLAMYLWVAFGIISLAIRLFGFPDDEYSECK